MRTKFLQLTMALMLGLLTFPASAAMLNFTPSSPYTVSIGEILNVDVTISGLGSEIVSAYDLDVKFDSTFLNATGVSFYQWLGDASLFEVVESGLWDNSGGLVDFAAVSLLADSDLAALQGPLSGTIQLATLSFNVIQTGTASLDFQWGLGNDVKGANNQQIYPVPEPPLALLLVSGLLAFSYCSHRKPSRL